MPPRTSDVVIIGAGAAGLMCAIEAGRRGRRVVLIDHSPKIGSKILISGGGHCNFTHLKATPANYVSRNPHFCKSALARYTPQDFLELIKKHNIAYREKTPGQLFCVQPARVIVEMLLKECREAGVEILPETKVLYTSHASHHSHPSQRFKITTTQGDLEAQSLVIATGGLSLPKTGATNFGYKIAEQFGLEIVPPQAALDGFVFGAPQKYFEDLSGISLTVRVSCGGKDFTDGLLFTHTGLSGPAALQASLYWNAGEKVVVDWLPGFKVGQWLAKRKSQGGKILVRNLLSEKLPDRLAVRLAEIVGLREARLADVSGDQLKNLETILSRYEFVPARTVGYSRAEVTRGGVATEDLSQTTLESRKVPGLYFIGEVVDVTGELGGYNFQWAWASGWAAGQVV